MDRGRDEEGDIVYLMEQPGMKGPEREMLRRGGVQEEQIQDLDEFLRQYELYCAHDRGAEARWAIGIWLAQSQIGADVQDLAESLLVERAQAPLCFPNRREPEDPHLRLEMLQWVNTMSPVMATIYGGCTSRATPGRLRDLDEQPSSSSRPSPRTTTRTARSRSPHRPVPHEDDTDDTTLMELPRDTTVENGEEEEPVTEETDDGTGVGDLPGVHEDCGNGAVEGGDHFAGGLGGREGEALRTDFEHYLDVTTEGGQHVDRLYEVERVVRDTLHDSRAATAREITRRLLERQAVVTEVMFYLQRGLDLALRVCPSSSDGRLPVGAQAGEAAIWRKITGLFPDIPHVRELGEATEQHLRRRERALQAAEEEFRASFLDTGERRPKARPRPSSATTGPRPAAMSDHDPTATSSWEGGSSGPTRSRSPPRPRPRPSTAPNLAHVDEPRLPPCLRPWWDRPVGDLLTMPTTPSHAEAKVRPPDPAVRPPERPPAGLPVRPPGRPLQVPGNAGVVVEETQVSEAESVSELIAGGNADVVAVVVDAGTHTAGGEVPVLPAAPLLPHAPALPPEAPVPPLPEAPVPPLPDAPEPPLPGPDRRDDLCVHRGRDDVRVDWSGDGE